MEDSSSLAIFDDPALDPPDIPTDFGPAPSLWKLKVDGDAHFRAGRYRDALECLETILARYDSGWMSHPRMHLLAKEDVARCCFLLAEFARSEGLFREILEQRLACIEEPGDMLAIYHTYIKLGGCYLAQGRPAESEPLYQSALYGLQHYYRGHEHPDILLVLGCLALVRLRSGYHLDCETILRQVFDRFRMLDGTHPYKLAVYHNLAILHGVQGHLFKAEELFRWLWQQYTKTRSPDHPACLELRSNLALCLERQGRYEESKTLYREVLAGHQAMLGEGHPYTTATAAALNALIIRDR
jgi:tetratricopeptide (TPR) repeat protein